MTSKRSYLVKCSHADVTISSIAWHASSGLALQILERQNEIYDVLGSRIRDTEQLCKDWIKSREYTTIEEDDSGMYPHHSQISFSLTVDQASEIVGGERNRGAETGSSCSQSFISTKSRLYISTLRFALYVSMLVLIWLISIQVVEIRAETIGSHS